MRGFDDKSDEFVDENFYAKSNDLFMHFYHKSDDFIDDNFDDKSNDFVDVIFYDKFDAFAYENFVENLMVLTIWMMILVWIGVFMTNLMIL